jgi:NAD(P)-dependent dehydrogenase (short-subunit alcohol dehydrogenase family)
MTLFDAFRYDGKRALVVGGATGMGAAAAELLLTAGAEVIDMDFAEVTIPGAKAIHVNLAEKDSIDAAIEEIGGPVDAVLSCAGVADGTPGIEKINFIGHRHLIDRAIAKDLLPSGSAIGFISSAAGSAGRRTSEAQGVPGHPGLRLGRGVDRRQRGRRLHVDEAGHLRLRGQPGLSMMKRGIRINAICPGPTDTPLAQANKEMWLGFGSDFRGEIGVEASTPLDQAYPLVFLCSDAALGHQRHHHDHRRRLHQLGHHRDVPARDRGRQLPARSVLMSGADTITRVGVVGCGLMGFGHRRGVGPGRPRRGGARIRRAGGGRRPRPGECLVGPGGPAGKLSEDDRVATFERVSFSWEPAVLADRQIVVEAIPEIEALKLDTFRMIDKVVTDLKAVLASNTSSIPIMKLAMATDRPEQ